PLPWITAQGGRIGDAYTGEAELGETFHVAGAVEVAGDAFRFTHAADFAFGQFALGGGASVTMLAGGGVKLEASRFDQRGTFEPASSGALFAWPLACGLPDARLRLRMTMGPDIPFGSPQPMLGFANLGFATSTTLGFLW